MRKITAWLVAVMITWLAMPALAASDKTCLTGDDPVVGNDAAQIAALEAAVDEACPCDGYDGTAGKTHRDYVRCTTTQVETAIESGHLRSTCKVRVTRAFRRSTCGLAAELDAVPCLQRNSPGKLRCFVMPAAACQDRPGRHSRVACPDYQRCVDAGDSNGDYHIDARDSGACVPLSIDTPTQTPTATPTFTPTWTATPSATASATCGSEPPIVHVVVNPDTDFEEEVRLPPYPQGACPNQNPSAGGCALISALDGSIDFINVFDASASFDPRPCVQDPSDLSYKWEIISPPALLGSVYTSNGISGYLTDTLTMLPSSLPSLEDTDAGSDTFWRVRLTVTSLTEPMTQKIVFFRFKYIQTELSLQMSSDCQRIGHIDGVLCTFVAINGLPTTEPH